MSNTSKIIVGLLATTGVAVLAATPARAVGSHPFCMQGSTAPGLSDCSYATYEQCQATASGRYLYCIENPYYNAGYSNDLRVYRGRTPFRSAAR
jgi:uncharacterized protein DUF3551